MIVTLDAPGRCRHGDPYAPHGTPGEHSGRQRPPLRRGAPAGATPERKAAVDLGARAFRDFLTHHASRRLDGRPWRLVIAGDLFDFMSVVVPSTRELPARSVDERRYGLDRSSVTAPGLLDATDWTNAV